jgi:quercetin dioxygenase-like cupin family protein
MNASSLHRTFSAFAIFTLVSIGGIALAHHAEHSEVKVNELSRRDIVEKLNGYDASATVVEVTFEPGQQDTPHTHAGPVFGYVIEGEYEHAIDDGPVTRFKAGDTFYEPSGCIHRVARNPNDKTRTSLLAVILGPREETKVTVPVKTNH